MYKPYTGPSGPSERQIAGNNQAMLEEIQKIGFVARLGELSEVIPELADEDIQVIIFGEKEQHVLGYDRWGFSSDSETMDLDQADWETTIEAVKELAERSLS